MPIAKRSLVSRTLRPLRTAALFAGACASVLLVACQANTSSTRVANTRHGGGQYETASPSRVHPRGWKPVGVGQSSFGLGPLAPSIAGYPASAAPAQADRNTTPPSIFLEPGDELWVIERRSASDSQSSLLDDRPGTGCLVYQATDVALPTAIPLTHTDVRASITGIIASVDVTQTFANPYATPIEAAYLFPLPDNAAVSDFVMTIAGRSIRGVIRERKDAERIYNEAKQQGYSASILTQERSNIFSQRVANIEPGKAIDVRVTYFHTLGYRGGGGNGAQEASFEFVFPMTIGPRFTPSGYYDNLKHESAAVAQVAAPAPQRATDRTGRDISLSLQLNAGLPIEWLECPSHDVRIDMGSPIGSGEKPRTSTITLAQHDSIPNRDFVLRYRLSGDQTRAGIMTTVDSQGQGYFTMMLAPPQDLRYTRRGPVEFIFVVDCSGSMKGESISLCKQAVERAISQLRPEDTFQIVRFSDSASTMARRPVIADERNIRDGIDYVRSLEANGGTMLINGLRSALRAESDWKRSRYIWFLTDGFIGNEPEVLSALRDWRADSRIFSVGIGSSPNRTLLNSMARLGRGAAAYIANADDAREMTDLFVQRTTSAAMTGLRIDWGNWDVSDVYPSQDDLPDLCVDRPIMLVGKFRPKSNGSAGSANIEVRGRVGTDRVALPVSANGADDRSIGGSAFATIPALAQVWARTKIQSLDDQSVTAGSSAMASESAWNTRRSEIKDLSLRYGVISAYTSFLAVDSLTRVDSDVPGYRTGPTTVTVPNILPAGTMFNTGGTARE